MNEHEMTLALEIIEKVRVAVSALRSPKVRSIYVDTYSTGKIHYRVGMDLEDGLELSLQITEQAGA